MTVHDVPGRGYAAERRLPTAEEHRALATSVGWDDHFDWATLPQSLAGSLTGVVVLHAGAPVAMGRLVGDGAHYFYVQDLIVHPDHREEGLGTLVLEELLAWIARTAPSDAFVGLFSSPEAETLYAGHGFGTRDMTGMHRTVRPLRGPGLPTGGGADA
ncbi:GNAT family N-acetyltransferase [Microbacteriaceae bacterium 4G12]